MRQVFIARLADEMNQRQISGNQLAKAAKIGQSTMSRILNSKQDPTLGIIQKIADVLGLPAWALVMDSGQIEQRVIRPKLPAVQQNVVRLPSPYGKIFAKPHTTRQRPSQPVRKKR